MKNSSENKNSEPGKIVTRFAPSPTGNLHIGSFRTALFNYLYAKRNKGKVILRIEDTDKERSKPEYEKNIFEGLEWLGLTFDETYKQSERSDVYARHLGKLIEEGKVYVSQESAEPTDDKSSEKTYGKKSGGEKRSTVIRFKNPNKVITFYDIIRGEISFDTTELGDFVIAKSPTEPLYHLAVVVDDHEMGVTHVIRGDDHVSNTPRQILIGQAIGARLPIYAHLPLILAPDKSKLSKRRGARALTEYRDDGYQAQALINFMALLGWNPGTDQEFFSLQELIEKFDVAQVQKSGAVYNEEKLRWMNREYLKRKPFVEISNEIRPFFESAPKFIENKWKLSDEVLLKIIPVVLDRIDIYRDISKMIEVGEFDYLFEIGDYNEKELMWRDEKDSERTLNFLAETREILHQTDKKSFEHPDNIKQLLWDYATLHGRGAVLWPIRFALTGKMKSPDPFTLISILGQKESIKRLDQAIKKLKSLS